MTKKEKLLVKWCVEQIMDQKGDFYNAIDKLMHLYGGCYPIAHHLENIEPIEITELLRKVKNGGSK